MSAQMMAGGGQGAATGSMHDLLRLCDVYTVIVHCTLYIATIGGVNEDLDEMAELERKARQMAEEAEKDQPRLKRDVLFVRC